METGRGMLYLYFERDCRHSFCKEYFCLNNFFTVIVFAFFWLRLNLEPPILYFCVKATPEEGISTQENQLMGISSSSIVGSFSTNTPVLYQTISFLLFSPFFNFILSKAGKKERGSRTGTGLGCWLILLG